MANKEDNTLVFKRLDHISIVKIGCALMCAKAKADA